MGNRKGFKPRLIKLLLCAACLFVIKTGAYSYDITNYNPEDILREHLWEEYLSLPYEQRPKVGLALSAGGARGFAHTGLLKVLVDAGFPIDYIAGTSMGSVVGSLFASGMEVNDLIGIAQGFTIDVVTDDINLTGVLSLLFKDKLLSSAKIEHFFISNLRGKTFEELNIPFSCSAMDINTGEKVVFSSGPLATAVRASMNIPGIFEPVEYRQRYLVDGGIVDYLPVSSARMLGADWVLAHLTIFDFTNKNPSNVLTYIMQSLDIRGALLVQNSVQEADYTIFSPVGDIGSAEFNRMLEAAQRGLINAYSYYTTAQKSLILFSLGSIYNVKY